MTMYKIKDILDIANNIYNLKINSETDPKKITAMKKAIRRALQARKIKAPYECTESQAYYLLTHDMKKYFFTKSAKVNPNLIDDSDAFNKAKEENLSQNLTYQEALINCKLDYLIQLLGTNDQQTTLFKTVDFTKAYINYRNHLDSHGYPMPGYSKAKSELENSSNFFTILHKFNPEK